jgi:hypothetical protein
VHDLLEMPPVRKIEVKPNQNTPICAPQSATPGGSDLRQNGGSASVLLDPPRYSA